MIDYHFDPKMCYKRYHEIGNSLNSRHESRTGFNNAILRSINCCVIANERCYRFTGQDR